MKSMTSNKISLSFLILQNFENGKQINFLFIYIFLTNAFKICNMLYNYKVFEIIIEKQNYWYTKWIE